MFTRLPSLLAVLAILLGAAATAPAAEENVGGKIDKIEPGKITFTSGKGKTQTHAVPKDATITYGGKPCKFEDLEVGFPIVVTFKTEGKERTITKIVARKIGKD